MPNDATAQPAALLQTRALTKEFRGFRALSDVSLSVAEGTVHALVGPRGAGKSTVLNLLTGFLAPTSGRILFRGEDIAGWQPEQIARLGIARPLRITSLVDQLGVVEHIELALARDPRLLLLDEPTAGMGREDVDRMITLVSQAAVGRAVVLVDHNMRVVRSLADTVTVLQAGRVLAEGSYDQVRHDERVIAAYLGQG
ncbi:branched-chain amino acid transport system ATP-binding protein [Phycicoccus badiiscoriae]|uniref:Branched-chain amino acid transport system ATP-binding protein n=1 Tax=Pedococcus badiiscoriae TaxID=642776 RepID=A0A852WBZ5_9MICO|nr:ATP-binding cassette domain-containing protein [Pedococcus badiiscoriae]NYG06578.1 branched-chain amino acid transport system ATP-binding protein [Pedococcus badiiscoriae]